jgi:hypothetical protein
MIVRAEVVGARAEKQIESLRVARLSPRLRVVAEESVSQIRRRPRQRERVPGAVEVHLIADEELDGRQGTSREEREGAPRAAAGVLHAAKAGAKHQDERRFADRRKDVGQRRQIGAREQSAAAAQGQRVASRGRQPRERERLVADERRATGRAPALPGSEVPARPARLMFEPHLTWIGRTFDSAADPHLCGGGADGPRDEQVVEHAFLSARGAPPPRAHASRVPARREPQALTS